MPNHCLVRLAEALFFYSFGLPRATGLVGVLGIFGELSSDIPKREGLLKWRSGFADSVLLGPFFSFFFFSFSFPRTHVRL